MEKNIIIAGFGGQGVLLAGEVWQMLSCLTTKM